MSSPFSILSSFPPRRLSDNTHRIQSVLLVHSMNMEPWEEPIDSGGRRRWAARGQNRPRGPSLTRARSASSFHRPRSESRSSSSNRARFAPSSSAARSPRRNSRYRLTQRRSARRAYRGENDAKQSGDPEKAIAVILEAVDAAEPPLRLPLGPRAYSLARDKFAAFKNDMDAWERDAMATDFDA